MHWICGGLIALLAVGNVAALIVLRREVLLRRAAESRCQQIELAGELIATRRRRGQ